MTTKTSKERALRAIVAFNTTVPTVAAILNSSKDRALLVLAAFGKDGACAGDFGAEMWPARTSKTTSNGGGGDYAAQMLLGRLRKAGFVRVQPRSITSIWELTALGHSEAERLRKEAR
jgi:hypothetical protein